MAFPQGDEAERKYNALMQPVYPNERLHASFRALSQEPGYSPASHLISELAYAFTDPDGNFIEQFQTTGFDARMWELYLFIMLSEEACRFDRTELLKGTDASFDRIVHTSGWEDRLKTLIRNERIARAA